MDLYVGNLGPNRLYRNNGDGTFEDVTDTAGVAGDEWTTSSVFADLDQDALPDLYVANYTDREETARTECGTSDAHRACTPDVLTAADHRCYLNSGDGTFRDITATCGILGTAGKGLGLVAWDFLETGRLGLFVANDTTPDFLFLSDSNTLDGTPQFRNEAVVRGVAYDADGNPQASMGVAAGDVTGDGRIDLMITDFYASGNSLFSQDTDGYFDDLSKSFGVHAPSLTMLGFGCHFADLDSDGWNDLLVINGHVDQPDSGQTSDRMQPQLFHNHQGKRFAEIAVDQLGAYFQGRYLGRGLALLDWNRDGRTDFAVSNLQAAFSLVTNATPAKLPSLLVRLVGTAGCREPTGATIRLLEVQPEQVRLQTAGDGFLVTNERRHTFAVPADQRSVRVEVRWPSGAVAGIQGLANERGSTAAGGRRRAAEPRGRPSGAQLWELLLHVDRVPANRFAGVFGVEAGGGPLHQRRNSGFPW